VARSFRTPTLSSLTKNQHNKFLAMMSIGYPPEISYQYRNINMNRINNIALLRAMGHPLNRALTLALTPNQAAILKEHPHVQKRIRKTSSEYNHLSKVLERTPKSAKRAGITIKGAGAF
jgi:hypothetical protein